MTSPLFLTPDELHCLTGYRRTADQRRWLTAHDWRFEVSAIGRPIVSRQHAEAKLAGLATVQPAAPEWKPNLAAIRKAA